MFTKCLCKEVFIELGEADETSKSWSQDQSTENIQVSTVLNKEKGQGLKNTPIGLNSLSKTFNIIEIVGQGDISI